MKALSLVLASATLCLAAPAMAGDVPTIAAPLVRLRKAPVFTAPEIPLAKTWGVALPIGTSFEVEKVYGRWIFGHPVAPPHMLARDYPPPGWVFSRSLLLPGDTDTISPNVAKQGRAVLYYAQSVWPRIGLSPESPLDFLENIALSRRTLAAFSTPEEPGKAANATLEPAAMAAEENTPAPLGLTGTDLRFLDQEIKVVRNRHHEETRVREAKRAHAIPPPPLAGPTRVSLLGRSMLDRYLEQPALSLEELDGHIYMRATAMRALQGCPAKVQRYWQEKRWAFFRVFRLKSRPEIAHPWFEIALPGGYFGVSGRAIELASNEAELAFLLARQLVRELRVKRPAVRFPAKGWPDSLSAKGEQLWDQVLQAQSTRDSEGFDVADEIAVDMQAVECIARAGYRPMAAIAYLKKMALHREDPWAAWYARHAIGLDYRIERVTALTQAAVAEGKFPEGQDSRERRFASAVKQWNILP